MTHGAHLAMHGTHLAAPCSLVAVLAKQPLFRDRLIPKRVATAWGALSIVEAERLLLREALKDPLNDRQGCSVLVNLGGGWQPQWGLQQLPL